jgi:hypothetical protein
MNSGEHRLATVASSLALSRKRAIEFPQKWAEIPKSSEKTRKVSPFFLLFPA